MNKMPLEKLDLDLCYEKLESGLEVFIVKKDTVNSVSVKLTTRFGSNTIEFVPKNKNKMKRVPLGIAHFLEHQMFNMEDGTDPMEVFGQSGSDCNAFTNNVQTTYLFDGMHNALENIEYLLHYVASPYFTDASVEKEKGIIVAEDKMYLNYPDTILEYKILENTFQSYPSKYPVIGTEEEILKTTKEDLMTCYETFYHPSNMFLTVVGNINPTEVIEVARKSELNQKHLKDKKHSIKVKEYEEPIKVVKEYEEVNMDVVVPKVSLNYKINIKQFNKEERRKLYLYLSIMLDSKLGRTSLFLEKMRNDQVVVEGILYNIVKHQDFFLINVFTSTKEYEEFVKRVKKELEDIQISEEEFKRKQKVLVSSYVYLGDNISSISNKINNDLIIFGDCVLTDHYSFLKSLNYYEMYEMLKKISFKNQNVVVVRKK